MNRLLEKIENNEYGNSKKLILTNMMASILEENKNGS